MGCGLAPKSLALSDNWQNNHEKLFFYSFSQNLSNQFFEVLGQFHKTQTYWDTADQWISTRTESFILTRRFSGLADFWDSHWWITSLKGPCFMWVKKYTIKPQQHIIHFLDTCFSATNDNTFLLVTTLVMGLTLKVSIYWALDGFKEHTTPPLWTWISQCGQRVTPCILDATASIFAILLHFHSIS